MAAVATDYGLSWFLTRAPGRSILGWPAGNQGKQAGADIGFHTVPDRRVAFNLGMGPGQVAVPPGVVRAIDGVVAIVKLEISDDMSARRIGRANRFASVNEASDLEKINRLSDVGGNVRVILAALGNTIDLNGQQNGDAELPEGAREVDALRRTPTVSIENDARLLFLGARERAIMVGIEKIQDLPQGFSLAMIFERLDVNPIRIFLPKMRRELNFRMDSIVMTNVAAQKTNNDGRSGRWGFLQ